MLTDQTRDMLVRAAEGLEARIAQLEDGLARAAAQNAGLVAENAALTARLALAAEDNTTLRARLRMVTEKGRPVPSVEPDERDVGVAIYLGWSEWGLLISAQQGWSEDRPGVGASAAPATNGDGGGKGGAA